MNEIILAVLSSSVVTATITAGIQSVFNRKKVKIEVEKNKLEIHRITNQMALDIAKERTEDIERLEKRIEGLESELETYKAELSGCIQENSELRAELNQIRKVENSDNTQIVRGL